MRKRESETYGKSTHKPFAKLKNAPRASDVIFFVIVAAIVVTAIIVGAILLLAHLSLKN